MNWDLKFRFAESFYLYGLMMVPFLWLLAVQVYKLRKSRVEKQIDPHLLKSLISSVSISKKKWKLFLQLMTIVFFILALARPQSGQGKKKVKSEGIEILLLVDVSNSMLAEDIKPSRLEFAKKELFKLLDQSTGDRVGLVAFAGSAALQSPVTQDKAALKMYIESLGSDTVSSQGTEFKKAFTEASEAFKRGGVEEGENSVVTRAIIVVSDGEDNEVGATQMAQQLVEKEGIHIFSMGIGTEKGAPIPIRDRFGVLKGYRKDNSGQTILTKTSGTILKKMAQVGKGSYYHATFSSEAPKSLYRDIQKLEKATFDSFEVKNYDENYQFYLFLAIVLGLIEVFLGERKAESRLWRGRFETQ